MIRLPVQKFFSARAQPFRLNCIIINNKESEAIPDVHHRNTVTLPFEGPVWTSSLPSPLHLPPNIASDVGQPKGWPVCFLLRT